MQYLKDLDEKIDQLDERIERIANTIEHIDNNVQQMSGLLANYVEATKEDIADLRAQISKVDKSAQNGNGARY